MQSIFESITAIPAITALALLAAQVLKSFTPLDGKHLPAFCGALGTALGIACFLWVPGFLPAENVLVSAAIGAVSGWAATGIHQTKKNETEA